MPPKSSLRQRAATPAKSTRAASILPQDTPGARRSTRNVFRQSLAPRDVISNPALPEIQTQQSYAYGSSKTPALPEQLQARDMSMRAVVNRLDDAAAEAERNLEAHAAEKRGATPESQVAAREARAQRRASREPSQQPPETPDDLRRKDRTAAWIESSQLDDIEEEKSSQDSPEDEPETPIRNREASLPSSFPTGSFANHSYSYERGERKPNFPEAEIPVPEMPEKSPSPKPQRRKVYASRTRHSQTVATFCNKGVTQLCSIASKTLHFFQEIFTTCGVWISRLSNAFQKSMRELPDSPLVSILFKSLITVGVLSVLGFFFCSVWTRFCDIGSTSIVSRSLQQICGTCLTSSSSITSWNISGADSTDLSQLIAALQRTQAQIAQLEARLNSRIDSSRASQSSEMSALRAHQDALETRIHQLSEHQPLNSTSEQNSISISSPLMSQINFFSPSNDAVVLPYLTSPTLSHNSSSYFLPIRVALNMIGLRKRIGSPSIAALEPWSEEGDRWCAAPPAINNQKNSIEQVDFLRLGIQTRQPIYPTELIIEHFPSLGSLQPEITPKDIEVWADFSTLSHDEWAKLHTSDLISESPDQDTTFLTWLTARSTVTATKSRPQTWARIGTATYHTEIPEDRTESYDEAYYDAQEVSADQAYTGARHAGNEGRKKGGVRKGQETSHVQRFNLLINQSGLLHYSSRFLVRVKSNYGGAYTCLYRVRLHGLPVNMEKQKE